MLGAPNISPDANFFELGGDSLLAVHFLAEFDMRTGRKIKMAQFMADPTIRGMAAHLGASASATPIVIARQQNDVATPGDSTPYSQRRPQREPTQSVHFPSPPSHRTANCAFQQEEAELRAFLDRYVHWMCTRDGAALGNMFAPDDRCASVGVSEGIVEGFDAIKQHYHHKCASMLESRAQVRGAKIFVFAEGRAATIAARLDSEQIHAKNGNCVTFRDTRLTFVMEKHDRQWRVVHMHCSLPVGGPVETLD